MSRAKGRLKRSIPIVSWLPGYQNKWFRADLLAGLTIMALLVPEGMAYAELAGVPPQAAFYAAPIGLLLYAVFGTSRQLVVAVSSGVAVMSASIVGAVAAPDSSEFIVLTAGLAILTGLVAVVAGLLKFGRIARFFSHSVLVGFVSGLAIFIIVKQLPKIFGLESGEGNTLERIVELVRDVPEAHMQTLVVGVGTVAVMLIVERWFHRVPAALVALVFGITVVTVFGLDQNGVEVVGDIPGGLAAPQIPDMTLADVGLVFTGVLALTLFIFAEAIGPARSFASAHGYRIDEDQELIGLGMANLGAGLFQGFPIGASLSKSAASDAAGGRTQVAGVIAAIATVLVALFFTPIFANLPEAGLGAIVVVAVSGMFDYQGLRRLFDVRKAEFGLAMVALVGVLWFDEVIAGLLVAVVVSLIALIARASSPKISELVRLPGGEFRNAIDNPNGYRTGGLIILRPDEGLFFANAGPIREQTREILDSADRDIDVVLMDLSLTYELDIPSSTMLAELVGELTSVGVELRLANVRAAVKSMLETSGTLDIVGAARLFPDLPAAARAYVGESGHSIDMDDLEVLVQQDVDVLVQILNTRGARLTPGQRAELASAIEALGATVSDSE